jgi:hypothetical protein
MNPLVAWIMRPLMFIAAIITGWFVAADNTATFDVFQMAVSVILIGLFVAAGVFWPILVRRFKSIRAQRAARPTGTQ